MDRRKPLPAKCLDLTPMNCSMNEHSENLLHDFLRVPDVEQLGDKK